MKKSHQSLQQRIDWNISTPELGAEEYHRTGESEREVVVLYGVLEIVYLYHVLLFG